jgi:hypothetical protein
MFIDRRDMQLPSTYTLAPARLCRYSGCWNFWTETPSLQLSYFVAGIKVVSAMISITPRPQKRSHQKRTSTMNNCRKRWNCFLNDLGWLSLGHQSVWKIIYGISFGLLLNQNVLCCLIIVPLKDRKYVANQFQIHPL